MPAPLAKDSSPPPDYHVRLDVFEGPLDLLLYLVRKEEVEVYDLSLERLTQQYLAYLAGIPQPDLDRAGDFIAMAAHLIYLKSRRLLPVEQRPEAEAELEEDPHFELIRQLVEYKKFKDAAGYLQGAAEARRGLFTRPPGGLPESAPDAEAPAGALALGDIGVFDLLRAYQRTLARVEAGAKADASGTVIAADTFTVAGKIEHLRAVLAEVDGRGVAFPALFGGAASRVEMAVTFLALLELVRLKVLRVVQASAFGEIMVFKRDAPAL